MIKTFVSVIFIFLLVSCTQKKEEDQVTNIITKTDKPHKDTFLASAEEDCYNGDINLCYKLGMIIYGSENGSENLVRARNFFKIACEKKHTEACFQYAVMLEEGKGGKADKTKAFKLYEKGCKANHPDSCNNAGASLMTAEGTAEDRKKGLNYFLKACNLGYQPACINAREEVITK